MPAIQRLPYLGTAEPDVLFVEWCVEVGANVSKGETIAVVETLKAAFDVEAERDGVLLRALVEVGERVSVQAAIGVVGEAGEELDEATLQALLDREANADPGAVASPSIAPEPFTASPSQSTSSPQGPIAPAARRRAQELGVDLASVQGRGKDGLVRLADVERAHAAGGRGTDSGACATGVMDEDFLQHIARDTAAFAQLSSDFKLSLYRRHGAVIGDGCHFGDGAVLRARVLRLGAGAFFGAATQVEANELVAGELLHFGARCRVRGNRLSFGDNAFFADDVEVGGGGAMDPEAELVVGSHGFVGEHSHLNPCRRLTIGDEVVVSRSAVLMTHSFGASVLKGYPNRFAPVTIGDTAQIGIGAVLFPGVEVGPGAIVMSGSSVVSAVPPGRMFGGVPARDVKSAATAPVGSGLDALVTELLHEFARQLQLRGRTLELDPGTEELRLTARDGDTMRVVRLRCDAAFVSGNGPPVDGSGIAEEVRVAVRWPDDEWRALPPHVVGIDLDGAAICGRQGPLANALREFLRKRGVRLHPRSWTYPGGWL